MSIEKRLKQGRLEAMKTLLLIDSNAIIHRAYHAIPQTLSNRKGEQTNAVYGFATTLIKALEDLKPDYVVASFDLAAKTFRHEEYVEYKANRVKADQELYDQIPRVREFLEKLEIPVYEQEGFEADDVIGTISTLFEHRSVISNLPSGGEKSHAAPKQAGTGDLSVANALPRDDKKDLSIYIITGDKDTFQLVDGNVFVYDLKGGLSQTIIVDREYIKKVWDLDPEDFIDLKALAGDPSDNIPGVPGIGPKTAISLLQAFDTLEGIYMAIEKSKVKNQKSKLQVKNQNEGAEDQIEQSAKELGIKPRILRLLIEHKDQAFLSQRLATIRRDVPLDFDLEKASFGGYDRDKLREFFEEMGFRSLLKRFGAEEGPIPKTKQAEVQKEKDIQLKLL